MAKCGCSPDTMGAVASAQTHARAWHAMRRGELTPDVEVSYPVAVHCAEQFAARNSMPRAEAFRALSHAAKQPDAPMQMKLVFAPLPPAQALGTLAEHTMQGLGVAPNRGTLTAAVALAAGVGLAALVASQK